ncbi:hypothetical protein pipiens_013597 [Culex pipiens pipiens]|uniref:C2H2-type domain-containing protein n=1 Tax=Culex pipiens pipiens TaxID=38569 RepID=A0ABD1CXS1_CULPP
MVEFKCPACDLAFGDVEACFRHIRIHPQRTIQCPECRVDFRSLEAFKKHFRQRHLAKSAGPVFKCSVDGCEFFENNINKVYKHASWHVAKGQPVFCPFGCKTSKPLPTSNALRIHQMYFHRNRSAKATSVETECHPEPDQIQQDEPMELDTAGTGEMWIRPVATDLHRVEMVFGGLFLKLLSKNHVPDSAIQEIVVALGEAETAQTELLRSALRQAAITVEMNESSRTNLENLLGTTNVMGRCFGQAGLFRTAHMRKKYFRGNFRFVEPVNIPLQRNDEHNQCNYYYVPILETLKSMLEDEKLFKKQTLGEEASTLEILDFLAHLVNEKLENLIIQKEMGTNISAIKTDVTGPILVCIDMGDDNCMYYVYAEKTRLTEGTPCILGAVENLMTVYYVHNFIHGIKKSGDQSRWKATAC